MADTLIDASATATAARAAGQPRLDDTQLAAIKARYRGAAAKGITDNQHKRTQIAKDGLRLARRFRDHEDMILRFTTDLAVGFTSNQAERDVRPVKVAQRTSGGCWRTLESLAGFAIVQSYLSTAGKWGTSHLKPGCVHGQVDQVRVRPGLGHPLDRNGTAVGGPVVHDPEHPVRAGIRLGGHHLPGQPGERRDPGRVLTPAGHPSAVNIPGG